jgi:hypothetical protein
MLLVQPDASGTGYSLQQQGGLALVFTQLLDETLLKLGVIEQGQLIENRRHRLARRLGHGIAAAVIVVKPVVDDRLRHRLAAKATQGPRLACRPSPTDRHRREWAGRSDNRKREAFK